MPGDGLPAPADEKVNDIMYWQTTIEARDIEGAAKGLREMGYTVISTDAIEIPNENPGFKKGFPVRDPDGHVMQVIENKSPQRRIV